MDRIPVPAEYVLGPGDELLIRIWGKVNLDLRVTIDRNGQISLPKIGAVNVAGLDYAQLDSYLRAAVGVLYKDFELNVTLGQLRSIQVFVLGNARQPGAYTLSSLSTLVDALFASGGPSATGTMRRIQLLRNNHLRSEFDVYDLQLKGDKSADVQLLPGDVIYIPPVGAQIAIVGNVSQPGIFELKGNATVSSALDGAGGLTGVADAARALVERIENHKTRRVDEFTLDQAGMQQPLKDGDLLRISSISQQFENAVTIRGNVAAPGHFPWHEKMRISDLIPSRGFLITQDHWNVQNHLADQGSAPGDSRSSKQHVDMMADLVHTNAEINWDYAVIERLDDRDLSTRLIPFHLGNAVDNPASGDNLPLQIGDVITIFSRADLPLPMEKHATFVRVAGEVEAPGVYRMNPGSTLRDAVRAAGGLTSHSYLFASQLNRASTREMQEEQLKLSIDRMKRDLSTSAPIGTRGSGELALASLAAPQIALDQQMHIAAQEKLVSQLGEMRPTGRVVLGIKPDAMAEEDIPDFPLEDGDSFYVPPRLGTIQVVGEVYNANAFRYQNEKTLAAYLNDSGGPTRSADLKRVFLIRADGTVISKQSHGRYFSGCFDKLRLMPGDAVVVPPKLKMSGGFMADLPMFTQILSQTAVTGAVVGLMR
jgi:protein involved in polysaccharide export with SLBB domain